MVHFFKWVTAVLYAIGQGLEIVSNHWPNYGPFDSMETPEKNFDNAHNRQEREGKK